MSSPLILPLLLIVAILVGGNNAAVAAGTAVGARVIRKKTGLYLTCIGYVSGLVLEGDKLLKVRNALLPSPNDASIMLVLLVSLAVFILADLMRSPASLTHALIGALAGLGLATGAGMNLMYLSEIVIVWIAGPVIVIGFSAVLARLLLKRRGDPWWRVRIYRIGIVVAVFYSAYALGANTLGAVLAIIPSGSDWDLLVCGGGAVIGALLLGRGPISRVGEELYALGYSTAFLSQALGATIVELATQFGIPLSASRIVTSSTLGVGLSRPTRVLNPKTVYFFAAVWFAVPVLAFLLSFTIARFFYA